MLNAEQGALEFARRGFPVFRVVPNGKLPYRRGINEATTDAAVIRRWFARVPELNYGIDMTGRVALDIDPRKNPDGWFEELSALGDLPETLLNISPSGGMHYLFDSFEAGQRPLSASIDVRSTGGYVVGPGSTIDGKPYRIHVDAPLAPVPAHLAERLSRRKEKPVDNSTAAAELDTPSAIAYAEAVVKRTAGAVSGERNAALFRLACVLKDKGLSYESALPLLLDEWCPRCDPPYEDESEIEKSVASAYNNGQRQPGSDSPEREFENVADVIELAAWREARKNGQDAPEASAQAKAAAPSFKPLDLSRAPGELPLRRYLLKGEIERGTVAAIVGPGGGSKSALSNCIALGIALGDASFAGFEVVGGPQPVLIINNEDDKEELTRRITATCIANGIDHTRLNGLIHVYDHNDAANFLAVVRDPATKQLASTRAFREMREYMIANGIVFYIVDPFKSIHTGQENDNTDIDLVARAFTQLSRKTDAAGLIVHHSKKPGVAGSEGFAGDADSSRGAGALINAVRRAWTLYTMSKTDGAKYGMNDNERLQHVRFDGAKGNYTARSATPRWFKTQTVPLGNGDNSFALLRADLSDQEHRRRHAFFSHLVGPVLEHDEGRGMALKTAAKLCADDPLLGASLSVTTLGRRLQEMFTDPYVFEDKRLFWDEADKVLRVEAHP